MEENIHFSPPLQDGVDLISLLEWNKLSNTNPSDERSRVEAHHITDETAAKRRNKPVLLLLITQNSPLSRVFTSKSGRLVPLLEAITSLSFSSAQQRECLRFTLPPLNVYAP